MVANWASSLSYKRKGKTPGYSIMDILPDSMNGITELEMEKQHWETMRRHIISCLPEEACGILVGKGKFVYEVIPVTNVLHSPHRFRMDPEEQLAAMIHMDEQGYQMLGIFHSHIQGPDGPSQTDLDELTYPEVAFLIWSRMEENWQCRAFRLMKEGPIEIPIVIQHE
jgi:proteasome lid subunit RPN8/RPN11